MRAKQILEFERQHDLQTELGIGKNSIYNIDNVLEVSFDEETYDAITITFKNNNVITFHGNSETLGSVFNADGFPIKTYVSDDSKLNAIFTIYNPSNDENNPQWMMGDLEEIIIPETTYES